MKNNWTIVRREEATLATKQQKLAMDLDFFEEKNEEGIATIYAKAAAWNQQTKRCLWGSSQKIEVCHAQLMPMELSYKCGNFWFLETLGEHPRGASWHDEKLWCFDAQTGRCLWQVRHNDGTTVAFNKTEMFIACNLVARYSSNMYYLKYPKTITRIYRYALKTKEFGVVKELDVRDSMWNEAMQTAFSDVRIEDWGYRIRWQKQKNGGIALQSLHGCFDTWEPPI